MGAGPYSPPLEPVRLHTGASPEPRPVRPRPSAPPAIHSRGSAKDRPSRPKRKPAVQTQSDTVLLNFLGNHNYPEVAQSAFENPLQGSDAEDETSPSDDMNASVVPNPAHLRNAAEHALHRQDSMEGRVRSQSKSSASLDMIMNLDNSHIPRPKLDTSDQTLTLSKTSIGAHMLPVPALSAGSTEPPSALKTPDTSQSLPSLRDQLGHLSDRPMSSRQLPPLPANNFASPSSALQSPSSTLEAFKFPNSKPLHAATPTSAYTGSATSPPGTSHRFPEPRGIHDAAISPPSHHTSIRGVTSPQTESTPSSSIYSTGSFPQRSPGESISSPENTMQMDPAGTLRPMLPMPTAPGMNGGVVFRCKVPGCTAPPFQTQYLLNSHMNVHSSARPHYCPRKGCPRSEGGKGFKRKNEMIRHGLVHQSPGYACPFCPDREHKYPRPDNLQRHVKVHHVDKDKDDPTLRDVLNQRIDGGSRGRRKRANS